MQAPAQFQPPTTANSSRKRAADARSKTSASARKNKGLPEDALKFKDNCFIATGKRINAIEHILQQPATDITSLLEDDIDFSCPIDQTNALIPTQQIAELDFFAGDEQSFSLFPGEVLESQISPIQDAAIIRQQLQASFLGSYLPQDVQQARWLTTKFHKWFEERSVPMKRATDALLLLHRANVINDERLAVAGRQTHAKAVSCLQAQLKREDAAYDDTVLCAIASLAVCSRFRGFGTNEGDDMHYKGLMALLRFRGPDALRSDLAADVVLTFMPRALTLAVQTRTSFLFGQPEWQAALQEHCQDSPIKQIVLISCRIPNALARADGIIRNKRPDQNIAMGNILGELGDIDSSLRQCFQSWYKTEPNYRTTVLGDRFSGFLSIFGKQLNLCPQKYSSVYEFDDPLDAIYHGWYWVAQWGVRRALVDLSDTLLLSPQLSASSNDNEDSFSWRTELLAACAEIGDHICRTVPYIWSEPSVRRFRVSMQSQIYTARQCFEFTGARAKMDWCDVLLAELDREDTKEDVSSDNASIDRIFSGWLMLTKPN